MGGARWFVAAALLFTFAETVSTSCELALQDVHKFQPVFLTLDEAEGRYQFKYPASADVVRYEEGELVVLACPGVNNSLLLQGRSSGQWLDAACRGGSFVSGRGGLVHPHDVHCRRPPFGKVTSDGSVCMDSSLDNSQNEHKHLQIVFQFGEHEVPLVDVCFDARAERAVYSKYTIAKEISRRRLVEGVPNVSWWEGSALYSYDVAGAYRSQGSTLATILGDESLAEKYVSGALPSGDQEGLVDRHSLRGKCWSEESSRSECVLAEGHLAGETDFVYLWQQFSTMFYVNSAPQWLSLKRRNWSRLSVAIRRYAVREGVDLQVYVGTYGVATLEDSSGQPRHLYLHLGADGEDPKTPVPEILWRLVVDKQNNRGAVFLQVNNPYWTVQQAGSSLLNCSSISNSLSGSHWTNVDDGYTYSCSVQDFLRLVPILPRIHTAGMETLLLSP